MKILALLVTLFLIFQTSVVAQQTDDTTLAINNYFQISEEKPVNNNSSKLDGAIQSYVNVVQAGNKNSTYINSLQAGDEQIVIQKGNQNNYEYYNYYSKEESSLNVNQEGDKNSLQIFGENSLMKNAIINQKSNYKGMVIKNYTN